MNIEEQIALLQFEQAKTYSNYCRTLTDYREIADTLTQLNAVYEAAKAVIKRPEYAELFEENWDVLFEAIAKVNEHE